MKYELTAETKKKARARIKQLGKEIPMWETEYNKAIESREKSPAKYYPAITQRIKDANAEVTKRKKAITEFKTALKKGYIEI